MPVVATARLVATVTPSGDTGGTLLASVTMGQEPATLLSTVSRDLVNSCEATSIRTGYRIKLAGEWIDDADLVDVEHSWQKSTPVEFLTFSLIGGAARDYAVRSTLETWTLVEVEYWTVNGPVGAEREEIRFAGYVRPGGTEERGGPGGPGLAVKVQATNAIGRLGEHELCREIDPLSGMTRGAILADFCADAGITAVDFPDGAVYTKGIQAKNTKLLAWMLPFVEPEGWTLREIPRAFADGGPILTATRLELKQPPLAADDEWDLSRVPSFEIRPPGPAPSRYIVRGYGAVFVDEHGQETRVTVTEVEELYSPAIATQQQAATTGTITSTSYIPQPATLRVTQRITDVLVSRGGKPLSQETTEEGWYNPRRAKAVSVFSGSGSYVPLFALIDGSGQFVLYPHERFMEIARRKVAFDYNDDGDPVGATTDVYRWFLRTMGDRAVGDTEPTVNGAYLYGDDNSYFTIAEQYGQAEQHLEERVFDETTGAEAEVAVESYGWVAKRSYNAGTPTSGYYVRADGKGQSEFVATWRQYASSHRANIVVDGTLQGTVESKQKLGTYQVLVGFGVFAWGEFDSNEGEEKLIPAERRTVQYNVLAEGDNGTYEKVTFEQGKEPVREILSGRVPQVRYRTSPWTFLRQEPIELVVDDAVVESLLGFRREVLNNDHVQNLDEARLVIGDRRSRDLAYEVRLSRHETHLGVGDTVFLKHPDHSLAHRAQLVAAAERRSRVEPVQTGTYTFEVPW